MECEQDEKNNMEVEEEVDWLKTSVDCPYFDDVPTGIANNKNKRKKYTNKGGNYKRFKRAKSKTYVYLMLAIILKLFLKPS